MHSDVADDGRLDGLRQAQHIFDVLAAEWTDDQPLPPGFAAEYKARIERAARRIHQS